MADKKLSVVSGNLSKKRQPKVAQPQDELSKRWRTAAPESQKPTDAGDVIPLLDGWIRRLEREVGLDSAANES